MLYPLQFSNQTGDVSEWDSFGKVKTHYSRIGRTYTKKKDGYLQFHEGGTPVKSTLGTWQIKIGSWNPETLKGEERLIVPMLNSPEPIESVTKVRISRKSSEFNPPATCSLPDMKSTIESLKVQPTGWIAEIDRDFERKQLFEETKGLSFSKLTSQYPKLAADKSEEKDRRLADLQGQLTDLLSVNKDAVQKTVLAVLNEKDPSKKQFLIGALGGATGIDAQAGLLDLLDAFSKSPETAEWCVLP